MRQGAKEVRDIAAVAQELVIHAPQLGSDFRTGQAADTRHKAPVAASRPTCDATPGRSRGFDPVPWICYKWDAAAARLPQQRGLLTVTSVSILSSSMAEHSAVNR